MYAELRQTWNELTGPGGPFEIREVEVRGQKLRAYASAPPSLRVIWQVSAAYADRDYLVYGDERWTYADAHRDVASIANWLVAHGVGVGDRVAIAMRNYPEWMLAYWATLSIGATVVGMNAWWIGEEMTYAVKDSTPKVMLCDAERLERFVPCRGDAPPVTLVAVRVEGPLPDGVVPFPELLATGGDLPDADIDTDSDACIFYTSGTTGRPKGAQLTHRGCVNNLVSLAFWNAVQTVAAQKAGRRGTPPPDGQLCALVATPLFHVTANNCVAHGATAAGGKLVHMYKWDPGEALRLIERERVTNFSGVPTMARELLAHPDFASRDTSSLKALGGGGAQLQPDLVAKIEGASKGGRPSTGYGMTETCGIITANAADFFVDKPASVGPVMPCFEARCVDAAGNDVGPNGVGELWVKGAQVIRGYLNRPEATAEAITDGWMHTGDVARIDEDGFVYIVDRAKDMVLRGGENIFCSEVETVIFQHPDVVECAAFSVPDPRLGEEVGVAVVLTEASTLTPDALREHCLAHMARYKVPRYIWMRRELLPRNASGKFLKRELRDTLDTAAAG